MKQDIDMKQKFKTHPLLALNDLPEGPTTSITLDVGEDGYTLTTIAEGDDSSMLTLLAAYEKNGPINIRRPYDPVNIREWFNDTKYLTDSLLSMETNEERHEKLFDLTSPLRVGIPFQIIRYNGKIVGHCALVPGQKGYDPEAPGVDLNKPNHPTRGNKFVKLSFLLSPEHQQKGVIFKACKELLQVAANEFDVNLVYATSDLTNQRANKLLQGLMEWSRSEWGGRFGSGHKILKVRHRSDKYEENIELRRGVWWLWQIGGKKTNPLEDADTAHQKLVEALYDPSTAHDLNSKGMYQQQ
ncbi:hypothetical protein EG329_014112 [Mollisiaceae sp. DMI_Dod_QoI]|nr:hypothetical protein EG329_014112 [Helotiales sp. DMI_Dod_QoI]